VLAALHEAQCSDSPALQQAVRITYQRSEVPGVQLFVPSYFSEETVLRFFAPVKIGSLSGRCHGEIICLRGEGGWGDSADNEPPNPLHANLWRGGTGTIRTVMSLRPHGYCMYRQFNMQQFYVLPTQCVYVFCVDLRTNSDYFPIQH
jgi:hypothetical protein